MASSISNHFTDQNILFELQHGFREKRSCETQLTMLVDELAKNRVLVFDGTAPEKTGPKDETKFCGPRKMLQT